VIGDAGYFQGYTFTSCREDVQLKRCPWCRDLKEFATINHLRLLLLQSLSVANFIIWVLHFFVISTQSLSSDQQHFARVSQKLGKLSSREDGFWNLDWPNDSL